MCSLRRGQFLENDLPQFFKNLTLLGIDLREIETRYDEYVNATTDSQ